jgi:hypothetical protein
MPGHDQPLTVFGSPAIQLCYDEHFTSADVDLMVIADGERLPHLAAELGPGRSGTVNLHFSPLSSRDAARTCPRSRSESNRSELAEQGDGAKQSQQGRNEAGAGRSRSQ